MKRPAGSKNIVPAKCKEVSNAIYETDTPERVQEMLAGSVSCTLGALKASRNPLNERFVVMIGEVFAAHKASLEKDVSEKEAALAALTPSKTSREEAVEAAKAALSSASEALDKAKQEVKNIAVTVKEATATLKTKTAEQGEGDKVLEAIEQKLAKIQGVEKDSLGPILAGDPEPEEKRTMLQAIMESSKAFGFDSSLMEASFKVLEKAKDDRGDGFDDTCLSQLKASFAKSIAGLEAELAEGAPGKAARAAAVEEAAAAKAAAEKTQEDLKAAADKAKEEKDAAAEGVKAAKQSLDDFLPDLKAAGDALDESKVSLEDFTEGPLASYGELKDLTEDTFKPPEPEPEEDEPAAKKARTDGEADAPAGNAPAAA